MNQTHLAYGKQQTLSCRWNTQSDNYPSYPEFTYLRHSKRFRVEFLPGHLVNTTTGFCSPSQWAMHCYSRASSQHVFTRHSYCQYGYTARRDSFLFMPSTNTPL